MLSRTEIADGVLMVLVRGDLLNVSVVGFGHGPVLRDTPTLRAFADSLA